MEQKLANKNIPNLKSEQSYFMPKDPSKVPDLLTPSKFDQLAQSLRGSRLFNFVSGLVGQVGATAGGSVAAADGVRLSRALRILSGMTPGSPSAGSIARPDIIIQRPDGPKVFEAKFGWKNGQKDTLSQNQRTNYKRIDKDGQFVVIDEDACGCP